MNMVKDKEKIAKDDGVRTVVVFRGSLFVLDHVHGDFSCRGLRHFQRWVLRTFTD